MQTKNVNANCKDLFNIKEWKSKIIARIHNDTDTKCIKYTERQKSCTTYIFCIILQIETAFLNFKTGLYLNIKFSLL